ncbi:hypothetical protein C8R43DRAFT_844090, partial [Mycena crocata]
WAVKARQLLASTEMGPSWTTLLDAWWTREEGFGFEGGRSSHSTLKRPGCVGDWVQRARRENFAPGIKDPVQFGHQFQEWWIDINPEWRRGENRLVRDKEGVWESMDFPGANGFLNVIVCLKWWRDACTEESQQWRDAVDDVTWV